MSTSSKKSKPTAKKTSTTPMCPLCGEHLASQQCNQCQIHVCRQCFFPLVSLCKKCVSPQVAKKWKQQKTNWEKTLGVEWID